MYSAFLVSHEILMSELVVIADDPNRGSMARSARDDGEDDCE